MEPNYKARKYALMKCAHAAMDKHLKVFGIENGGQCFGAKDEHSLNKYGTAVECRRKWNWSVMHCFDGRTP